MFSLCDRRSRGNNKFHTCVARCIETCIKFIFAIYSGICMCKTHVRRQRNRGKCYTILSHTMYAFSLYKFCLLFNMLLRIIYKELEGHCTPSLSERCICWNKNIIFASMKLIEEVNNVVSAWIIKWKNELYLQSHAMHSQKELVLH